MKSLIWIALMVGALGSSAEASRARQLVGTPQPACELAVYAYDTLFAPEGWGTAVIALFEKKTRCQVRAITVGDAGQLVSRLALDARAKRSPAQVVLGFDQQVWGKIRGFTTPARGLKFPPWRAEAREALGANLEQGFVPIDFGVLALIWDSRAGGKPPSRWSDLLKPEWKRKLLLQDPRTSTPGLGFVLGAREVFGAQWSARARELAAQWLTLAPSWDQAYSMFAKGAAPLVWSYVTSQAYHSENGKTPDDKTRYRAVVFEEGNPVQLEGAALIASGVEISSAREAGEKFLGFIVSKEAQDLVALKNWMVPASAEVALPASFAALPAAKKVLRPSYVAADVDRVLREWLVQSQQGAR